MTLGAVAVSIVMVALNRPGGVSWLDRIPWLHTNQELGARALLQTIADSMITVAGVLFLVDQRVEVATRALSSRRKRSVCSDLLYNLADRWTGRIGRALKRTETPWIHWSDIRTD